MSQIQWTPSQWDAISDRGGQLLVSAAAGSGKTAVLVERAVGLLCDPERPVPADRLLIVTFTNAAAAEMRSRIADRLAELARSTPGSDALRRQRLLLQRAPICTIDAFCLQLIQRNFGALSIPPDFSTADEASLFALRQQVLAEVLEEAYTDPDFCAFADLYGRSRSDAPAGRAVLEVYHFLRSLPDPMQVLDRFCQPWAQEVPFDQTRWAGALLDAARQALESALRLNRQQIQEAMSDPNLQESYLPALESDRDGLQQMADLVAAAQWDDAFDLVQRFTFQTLKRLKAGDKEAGDTIKAMRDMVKDIHKNLKNNIFVCTSAEFEEDRRQARPLVEALARAVRAFDQRYFEAKVQEKVLEFSDFEHLALALLRGPDGQPTPLARQMGESFDAVMVDEYQDTNALQDTLYHCLARPDGSNLFFVGDLKQSIYRFRQADPAVFLDKLDRFVPFGQGYPARIDLKENFRSAPGVIQGVNYFFDRLMSRELGGVTYGPEQRLWAGASGEYPGGTEFRLLRTSAPAGDAGYIARRIRAMVEEGFMVREKTGGTRPARYGDFCILLRARGHFDLYVQALEAQGVPVYADTAGDLLDEPHIRPLAALLRVLDNPAQDVYLASVMLSPLFGFTPDDLAALRLRWPKGSLYGAVAAARQNPEDALTQRTAALYEKLAALRRLSRTLPAQRLLEEILADTGYLAAVGALENGTRRREDVRQFTAWAASSAGQSGLAGLVRMLDAAEDSGGLSGGSGGQTQPGCVSIMTVHRSKGLEFPVVFSAGNARKFNLTDLSGPVLCHAELGLGLMLRAESGTYPTAAHRAVRSTLHAETLSEEMRLLYVALTRARDRLIVTLPLEDPQAALRRLAPFLAGDRPDLYALLHTQSPANWLLAAAAMHPAAAGLCRECGVQPAIVTDAPPMEISLEDAPQEEAQVQEPVDLLQTQLEEDLRRGVEEQFGWSYPRQALTQVPAKVSVTSVVHEKEAPTLERPAFLSSQGLTAAERGTAMHAFLQFADFSIAAQDPAAEAQRQQEQKLLDPELAQRLDWAALKGFFQSPVFARMQNAQRLLREYDFITALPAARVAKDPESDYGTEQVLVQGVADAVLVWPDHAEIVDYKTDRGKTPEELVRSYRQQLLLYAAAIEKRLDCPVTRCTLYSLALGCEVDVPLEQ